MSGHGGESRREAARVAGFCVLSAALAVTAGHGISDALGAPAPPRSQVPVSPTHAASPPSLERPAGGTVRDAPAGYPKPAPMPAPAATGNYAGSGRPWTH